MFPTLENALERFRAFPQKTQRDLGYKFVAEGTIKIADGVITKTNPDNYNHFDLHEFEDTELESRFDVASPLMKP